MNYIGFRVHVEHLANGSGLFIWEIFPVGAGSITETKGRKK